MNKQTKQNKTKENSNASENETQPRQENLLLLTLAESWNAAASVRAEDPQQSRGFVTGSFYSCLKCWISQGGSQQQHRECCLSALIAANGRCSARLGRWELMCIEPTSGAQGCLPGTASAARTLKVPVEESGCSDTGFGEEEPW